MRKFEVIGMQVDEREEQTLRDIGLDIGVELFQDESENFNKLCFITLENTRFCIRKETMDKIELKEIIK